MFLFVRLCKVDDVNSFFFLFFSLLLSDTSEKQNADRRREKRRTRRRKRRTVYPSVDRVFLPLLCCFLVLRALRSSCNRTSPSVNTHTQVREEKRERACEKSRRMNEFLFILVIEVFHSRLIREKELRKDQIFSFFWYIFLFIAEFSRIKSNISVFGSNRWTLKLIFLHIRSIRLKLFITNKLILIIY